MTRRLLSGVTMTVALLTAAPAASADDASLFNAYNARQGEMDAAGDQYVHAVRRANRRKTARAWRGIIRANNFESEAIREGLRGHRARSRALFRRGNRTVRRCYREGRRAVRRFKAVGLTSPVGPISAT